MKSFQERTISRRNFILGLAGAGVVSLTTGTALAYIKNRDTLNTDTKDLALPGNIKDPTKPQLGQPSPLLAEGETEFEKNMDFSDLTIDAKYKGRTLVLVELFGGNQGFAMCPYANNGDFNSNHGVKELIPFDNEIGFHQELVDLAEFKDKIAIVEGVGHLNKNLSHFTMKDRWHLCDSDDKQNYSSGFWARTSNALATHNDGLVAASTSGYALSMAGVTAPFLSASSLDQLSILSDSAYAEYRDTVASFDGDVKDLGAIYQSIYQTQNQFPPVVAAAPDWTQASANGNPGDLGKQLQVASYLIQADVGIQVIHVTTGGFDLHGGLSFEYPELMKKVNIALSGFLTEIEEAGLADNVTVALASEFGRRVNINGQGSDHGNTSTLMVIGGNVKPGRYGQTPSLKNLDSSGNVKAEVPFDSYLASLAQGCLGVPADRLLTQQTEQLDMFI